MGKAMRRTMPVLLLLLLLSSQISCRPGKLIEDPATIGSSPPTEATPSPVESEEGAAKDITIYLINGLIIQLLPAYNHGAEAAVAELGIPAENLKSTGFDKGDAEPGKRQAELLYEAVAAKADIIIIDPEESDVLAEPIAEVFRSGIPIIVIDSKVDTDTYTAFLRTDDCKAGRIAAEELLKNMRANGVSDGEKAQVAIQVGNLTYQPIIDRLQGFIEYWNENAPELWELLSDDIRMNHGDAAAGAVFGSEFMADYPDLKGMFAPNNGSTVGFARALLSENRTDIAMVGFDFAPEVESLIRDGFYSVSTLLQRKYYMGYDAVKLAYDILQGGTPSTENQIDTGVLVVTRENIDGTEPDLIHNGY